MTFDTIVYIHLEALFLLASMMWLLLWSRFLLLFSFLRSYHKHWYPVFHTWSFCNAARNHKHTKWTKLHVPIEDIANWFWQFSLIHDAILAFSKMLQETTILSEFTYERKIFSPIPFYISISEEFICSHDCNLKNPGAYSLVSLASCTVLVEHVGWINIWRLNDRMFDKLTVSKYVLTYLGCLNAIKIEL